MSTSNAVHGSWCGARTYPTRCRYCGQKVFYFECNCGSKVFFAELGGIWPEHRCLELLKTTYGKAFVQRGMALQRRKPLPSSRRTSMEKGKKKSVKKQFENRRGSEVAWIKGVTQQDIRA